MTPNKAFKEIERVLKPGGAMYLLSLASYTHKTAKSKNESRGD